MTFGLSRRAFAKQIGCSVGWVQKLVDTGRCVLTDDGKIDGPASVARIAATADPGRADVAERHAAARARQGGVARPVPPLGDLPAPALSADDPIGRAEVKAMLMQYENAMLQIEQEMRRGKRFERAAVRREAAGLGAMLRAGIERVIDQTAPRIAATGDAVERRRIVGAEIGRLRAMIKREIPRALRRMRDENVKRRTEGAS
jgi:hypothetical protein